VQFRGYQQGEDGRSAEKNVDIDLTVEYKEPFVRTSIIKCGEQK
jgi:hypothetical protein